MSAVTKHVVHMRDGTKHTVEAEGWHDHQGRTTFYVGTRQPLSLPTGEIARIEIEGEVITEEGSGPLVG